MNDNQLLEDLGSVFSFDRALFQLGDTPVTIASLISFVVFLILAFVASNLLQRAARRVYKGRGIDEGVQYALNRLLHYVVLALGIYLALDNVGVSVSALAGLGAILAVGIGFGLQNIAQNFVSGLILLLERPIKKGDWVQVGETRGTVRDIRARATVVTTYDDIDIIVPNGQFITEAVINPTFQRKSYRIRVNVGVAYGSDTELVRDTLIQLAADHPNVLAAPAPMVFFEDFGDSSLNFRLMGWLADPRMEPRVLSDLRFAIDKSFREKGIEIPFPQRDLHIRSGWGGKGNGESAQA